MRLQIQDFAAKRAIPGLRLLGRGQGSHAGEAICQRFTTIYISTRYWPLLSFLNRKFIKPYCGVILSSAGVREREQQDRPGSHGLSQSATKQWIHEIIPVRMASSKRRRVRGAKRNSTGITSANFRGSEKQLIPHSLIQMLQFLRSFFKT